MLVHKFLTRIEEERGRLLHWAPLFLGAGVGTYFSLPTEPTTLIYVALTVFVAATSLIAWRWPWGVGPLAIAAGLVGVGIALAGARAHYVGEPVLGFRYYGPVEGRIVKIDRSQSDAVRLTLDRVRLDDVGPKMHPTTVRVSLHGEQHFLSPAIGQRIAMTAHLSGPNGPVEPGGFDFQRMAWFRGIGAVGYTRVPALLLKPPTSGIALGVSKLRQAIATWVRGVLPGETGAFAAAITTGDRSAMSRDTIAALRASNLAHLLAISGLHMGLLTGFIFQAVRMLLSLWQSVALRYPIKKLAACVAILSGAFYLALSGGNIATERAFIMVATMFVAILFDRRALSLRAVAMAAIIVLVLHPEALVEPGFQMSFAATTALVAVFGWLRDRARNDGVWRAPKWARPVLAVVISSFVAGMATAPFGAAHFNQITHYGLIANLLSVPIMGALIMPLAVLAALLAPIGLGWLPVKLMGPPIDWIIGVARVVSSLDGATGQVPAPPDAVLPLVAVGGILATLLTRRTRALSLLPFVAAMLVWTQASRPPILISASGGLVGVMTDAGRDLSKPRGESFAARSWLENDGDPADQEAAFARKGLTGEQGHLTATLGGARLIHLTGRGAGTRVAEACASADLVVLSGKLAVPSPPGCTLLDRARLSKTGAVALWPEAGGFRVHTARASAGDRLWTR
ncbi:ComEC/Rec2 family competence protein [Aliiroseovarius sediminis]|uniref:ComEC/Rec2 family competence protein n=1 Tax=Aliiroseovarius sediminis TaxID=2925839 RepID=UPI001F58CC6F|nr:ComEC/Rec2 family competence protein [uncultured Aliiroseovarius sp.]MCI2392911.1 ComEC family competence protein [Aliiroseovarius sediminis]